MFHSVEKVGTMEFLKITNEVFSKQLFSWHGILKEKVWNLKERNPIKLVIFSKWEECYARNTCCISLHPVAFS